VLFSCLMACGARAQSPDERLLPYIEVLEEAEQPVAFVLSVLADHDLVVFDDGLHTAVEPFEFYRELIGTARFRDRVKYIFVEVLPINAQRHIDDYMTSDPEDRTLLYPAFQADFSGTGWALATYFDLLHAIHAVNRKLPAHDELRVVAVNAPSYWPAIDQARDLELFRKTLVGNDYTMYRTILDTLDGFRSGRKGIFLTNTRHSYNGIEDQQGRLYWNVGTFLHQWHPGKTYSIRFHNVALFRGADRSIDAGTATTTAGMEHFVYRWIRMADGLWDSAFAARGDRPVAFALAGNVFGSHPYVGNHMHRARAGQVMSDANDALIFLGPLEQLHESATVDDIYTDEFKRELDRRLRILYTPEQLARQLEESGVVTVPELIDARFVGKPKRRNSLARDLPPRDVWKTVESSPPASTARP